MPQREPLIDSYDTSTDDIPTGTSGENTTASVAELLRQSASLENTNAGAIVLAERLAALEARVAALEGA